MIVQIAPIIKQQSEKIWFCKVTVIGEKTKVSKNLPYCYYRNYIELVLRHFKEKKIKKVLIEPIEIVGQIIK